MYDSEEDGDRRRGDKFARERDMDYNRGRSGYGGGAGGGRDSYGGGGMKRSQSSRRDDYGSGPKRSRHDSESEARGGGGAPDESTPMTFKQFMLQQDDNISHEDAVSKYDEYKIEIKKQQLLKFFAAHKEEEWFRLKYHPEESVKRKNEVADCLSKRKELFESLLSCGVVDEARCDIDKAKLIIRLMDTLTVRLEGGSDEDVEALKEEKIVDESITEQKQEGEGGEEKEAKTEPEEAKQETKTEPQTEAVSDAEAEDGEHVEAKPKQQLHKTSSIFMRNIPPSVTQQEIEALCQRSPGFLRVCLAEPIPERKFFRRGWATFKRDVNIKEICWNLNSIRIRDSDLNAIINRDLTRRVRTTNGVTAHKPVAQHDIRLAAKLVAYLDKRAGLYCDGETEEDREKQLREGGDLISKSKNPIMADICDVLIEEASAEEEELLGGGGVDADKTIFERVEAMLKRLDQLIWYLRVVHSVDFYNAGDYPMEDHMPNKCGMIHVRSEAPSGSQWGTDETTRKSLVSTKFVTDFTAGFASRVGELLKRESVSEEQMEKLGKKDADKELELFIQQNTVELAKDKWLCPLSGKKFKGPEFIAKHLASKHQERLDQVKQDAVFFNNYLADAKRPMEMEVKPVASEERRHDDRHRSSTGGGYERRSYGGGPVRGYGGYAGGGGGGRDNRGPRYYDQPPPDAGGRRDPRPQITYRDLDAPEDVV